MDFFRQKKENPLDEKGWYLVRESLDELETAEDSDEF